MLSTTNPSLSRRRQCLHELHHSAKAAGSLMMGTEMAEDLGVFIDSSDGEVSTPSPTLSSSSEDVVAVFLEGHEVACYLRDFMDKSTNIDGTSKFLEWPYVHHLSTHSNCTGYPSLTTSRLEIALVSGTHTGAFQP